MAEPATAIIELPFKPLSMDEIDGIVMKGRTTARELNEPRSNEFVTNSKGLKLHVHSHWPEKPARAFILFVHGYASHSNRPTHRYVEEEYAKIGVGYICMDLSSMGYSEGDPRCLVTNWEDIVDDILSVLYALTGGTASSPKHNLKRSGKGLPFFIFGHSMGGATSLATANVLWNGSKGSCMTQFAWNTLQALEQQLIPYFRGCILMSPLVKFDHLPEWSKPWLEAFAITFPEWQVPVWTRGDDYVNCRKNWASDRYIQYVLTDTKEELGGLTYWGGVRLGTGLMINDLCNRVLESVSQAGFPMIFIHDPEDRTCSISGSRWFVENAPSPHKRLIELADSLHDPMANMIDVVSYFTSKWVDKHLDLVDSKPDHPVSVRVKLPERR